MKILLSGLIGNIGRFDFNSLTDRINFQKSLYLLKELGAVKGRFSFSYYIFGPYSPDVAAMGFDLIERRIDSHIIVPDDYLDRVNVFKKMVAVGSGNDKWLELIATMHYIISHLGIRDKDGVFSELKSHHDYFNDISLLERAWSILSPAPKP